MASKKTSVPQALVDNLRAAMAVELTTIPTYLYAYWSIKPMEEGGSRLAFQASRLIMSVISEEMLHLGLVANVMNALGIEPTLNDPALIPKYPAPLLRHSTGQYGFEAGLLRLSSEAVDAFLEIELPSWKVQNPGGDQRGWDTIGEFYAEIEQQLTPDLDYSHGGQLADFNNPGLGKLIQVDSQESALHALELIVDQGEGYDKKEDDDEHELSHYDKFLEVQQLLQDGSIDPVHDVYPVIDNPFTEVYNEAQLQANQAFNSTYSALLDELQKQFTEGNSNLFGQSTSLMVALKQGAAALRQSGNVGGTGQLAGPTFEYLPADERI